MAFTFANIPALCQARVFDILEDHITRQQDISMLKNAFIAFVCSRCATVDNENVRDEWKRRLLRCRDRCRTVPKMSRVNAVRSSVYAYGAENVYVDQFRHRNDPNPMFSRDHNHGYYRRIPYEVVQSKDVTNLTSEGDAAEEHEITVRFPIVCDTLNNVDLVVYDVPNTTREHFLGDLVRCVSTPYDSFFVDDADASQLERFINVNNRLLVDNNTDRSVRRSGDKWIVPLLMCPFHDNDVAYPLMCPPKLTLMTKRSGGFNFELWGYMYYLENNGHPSNRDYRIPPVEYMSTGIYYNRAYRGYSYRSRNNVLKRGENVIELILSNPVTEIFFFGPDPIHIRGDVQLRINGRTEISMSVDMLEEEKRRRGLQDLDAWVLFFCKSRHSDYKCSSADVLNFSRVNTAHLVIRMTDDFPEEQNTALHVYAHAMMHMRFQNNNIWTNKSDYQTRLSTRLSASTGAIPDERL